MRLKMGRIQEIGVPGLGWPAYPPSQDFIISLLTHQIWSRSKTQLILPCRDHGALS